MEDIFLRVIILNYNESNYTISLIEQLRKQTFSNLEIVVVDNFSKMEELQIINDNLPDDVIIIYSDKNLGYSGGNNLGFKYLGKNEIDYFLVLNNDIIIEEIDFIEKMVSSMQMNRHLGVVASSPLVDTVSSGLDLSQQIQTRRILSKWNTVLINIPLFKFYTNLKLVNVYLYKDYFPFVGKEFICDTINGAAFIVEKDFIVENNYLDEITFLYYEEIVLGRQIKNSGKTCLLNGNTVIKHLQGISTKSSNNRINYQMERFKYQSSLYYLQKYENFGIFFSLVYVFLSEFVIVVKKIIK
jgi:GT2 family glycosyltransferase